ncbi:MAG TPA: DUF2024 family protein [Nitrosomonas sp.]|nr:DUF2024 family protein [Nitrosomonas sp.]
MNEGEAAVTSKECRFCHTDSRGMPQEIVDAISRNGYYIYKMEGCV